MPSPRLRNLFCVALSLVFFSFFITSAVASPPSAEASPSAQADLICHTDNPAECYPKVFSATEEFQTVRDDQDLPPGLHVRLNIWTGQKEARLNTPMAEDPALEGLPVDKSVVVVDPEVSNEEPQLPLGAPAYEPVGVVKEPQVQNPDFAIALDFLKEHAETAPSDVKHPLDDALVDLEDISHDMYYGKKIMEDAGAVKSLFCLLTQRDAQQADRDLTERRDFLASSILSSSLQNNPPAMREIESQWDQLMSTQCGFHQRPLGEVLFDGLKPRTQASTADEANRQEASWIRTSLPVVGRLMKSDPIRGHFMQNDIMRNFLQILLIESPAWEAPRVRVSRIVSDTFLDNAVGAKEGVWPRGVISDPAVCQEESTRLGDGCWEYHLQEITKETKAEWAQEMLDLLNTARSGARRAKDEL
ncbi:hypothetical protein JX265_008690 [Neoarthrinium moseri]|uniref:Nucleotide exchange factor SIL1 n=1 Tax=Neoarthrinium moseri TaxID=1658444 RepID=A0A9P9WHN2_9PEZI|nr:hypothetical protein JX265_008690 [Neoarthrinium moseri]